MNFLLTNNRWILALLVLASLLLSPGLGKLRLSYKVDDYFSASGQDLKIYDQYRQIFGEDDQFLLLALRSEEGIYEREFLRKIRRTKRALKKAAGVEQVLWLDDWIPRIVGVSRELVESIPERHLFVSRDHLGVSLLLRHNNFEDKAQMEALVQGVQESLTEFEAHQITIGGKVYFSLLLAEFMRQDAVGLFATVFILILLLLLLSLGSARMLLVALSIPLLAIAFTLGLMGNLGFHVNMFTTMVPTLILIISVSDIIHIIKGAGPEASLDRIRYHFAALLLTSVTTAIGFSSLLTTNIHAIMLFGAFVAIGVLYTFLLTTVVFSLLPSRFYRKQSIVDRVLDVWIKHITSLYRTPWVQLGSIALVLLLMATGIRNIRANSYLISGIPEDSGVRSNSRFFDEHFAGIRPLSIFIEKTDEAAPIPETTLLQLDTLIRIHFHTDVLLSPYSTRSQMKFQAEDGRFMRFYGLMPDLGSQISSRRADSLAAAIAANDAFAPLKIHYTGISRMSDKNTTDTSQSIFQGLLIALGVTFVLLALYFRGLGEAFVSLLVNVIPLLVLASVYGLIGIELRAGNSIAFAIAFGIAIDDTMHMLASYRKLQGTSKSFDTVIADAGKPIMMTTFVFAISFSALLLSQLEPVSVLGLSIVIGSLSALLADLIILPALLKWIRK